MAKSPQKTKTSRNRKANRINKAQYQNKYQNKQRVTDNQFANELIKFIVTDISHEGRGISQWGCFPEHEQIAPNHIGKKVFITGALPSEIVSATITHDKKSFTEAKAKQILSTESASRTKPVCVHFDTCGGCQLQHIKPSDQLTYKELAFQNHLLRSLTKLNHSLNTSQLANSDIGENQNLTWLPAIANKSERYRRKVRLGVRVVKDKLILGFRQEQTNRLTDISDCSVLHDAINARLSLLKSTLNQLSNRSSITHLEIAVGEDAKELLSKQPVTLLIRHMQDFSEADTVLLYRTFTDINWQVLSQRYKKQGYKKQNHKSAQPTRLDNSSDKDIDTEERLLSYFLPKQSLGFEFSVQDFIQVNADVNQDMVAQALALMDLQMGDVVVDLFSGLGNFSLPLAKAVGATGKVIGIEGSQTMCQRAAHNAKLNDLTNCTFLAQDLSVNHLDKALKKLYCETTNLNFPVIDAVLIDPPRAGAKAMLPVILAWQPSQVLYVSCNMATFVRDAIILSKSGYTIAHAGVMDMFPNTEHIEIMAQFVLIK